MVTAVARGPGPWARWARGTIPAWTADGYVSDRWRPVSPVTGQLDAFQWQTPVAALPSDKGAAIESSPFEEAMLATPRRAVVLGPPKEAEPKEEPAPSSVAPASSAVPVPSTPVPTAEQDNAPPPTAAAEAAPAEDTPAPAPVPSPTPAEAAPSRPAPLFRSRQDIPKSVPAPIPAVIPLVRAPDDPGVDDDGPADEFAEQIGPPKAQAGGWRGFLSRWGGD
jgi:HemY protein